MGRLAKRALLAIAVLCVGVLAAAAGAADLASHLGSKGPGFEAGLTPSKLGWGADDQVYPTRFVVNPVDLAEMVWVPAGTFRMGSTQEEIDRQWTQNGWDPAWKDSSTDEMPVHEVTLTRGFWLYKHEVTAGQYAKFLATTAHAPSYQWPSFMSHQRLPVNFVLCDDARAYAEWALGSLPTEAQWEWSARGPESRAYPWGKTWDRAKCNSAEFWARKGLKSPEAWATWVSGWAAQPDGRLEITNDAVIAHLRDVGSFPAGASWCGALDLAGNVMEWCADWYGPHYTGPPSDDPRGPSDGIDRVLRGGSWLGLAHYCHCAFRVGNIPVFWQSAFGFRVARAVGPGLAIAL